MKRRTAVLEPKFYFSSQKELAGLYLKSGMKNVGIMFLMTDAQVPNEHFLVLINDLLASGEVPDLFPDDEVENILAGVRNEVKGAGLVDTRENCWKFFIDRVRRQMKVVLCFSPVGSTLRVRSRKFPAIINCTQINWFHEWPQEALISVAQRFLQDLEILPFEYKETVARFVEENEGQLSHYELLFQVHVLRPHLSQLDVQSLSPKRASLQLHNT